MRSQIMYKHLMGTVLFVVAGIVVTDHPGVAAVLVCYMFFRAVLLVSNAMRALWS